MTTAPLPDQIQIEVPEWSWEVITPEMAAYYLTFSDKNNRRTITAGRVATIVNDMRNGTFTPSESDICFTVDGVLRNGHHRLTAVVESGIPLATGVKRKMPMASIYTMDTGRSRTPGDALTIDREKNTKALAAAIRLMVLIDAGNLEGHHAQASISQVRTYLLANPGIRHSTAQGLLTHRNLDALPRALAAAHFMIARVNTTELADHYLLRLATRTQEMPNSPVLAIDARLRNMARAGVKPAARDHVYLLLKGWNDLCKGRTLAKYTASPRTAPGQPFRLPDVARALTAL